uniref:Uncharacterized protein n=1 Tax=Oryza brachyantha TaxID=4533 RepID=J3M7G6_ORYBR
MQKPYRAAISAWRNGSAVLSFLTAEFNKTLASSGTLVTRTSNGHDFFLFEDDFAARKHVVMSSPEKFQLFSWLIYTVSRVVFSGWHCSSVVIMLNTFGRGCIMHLFACI